MQTEIKACVPRLMLTKWVKKTKHIKLLKLLILAQETMTFMGKLQKDKTTSFVGGAGLGLRLEF